MPTQYKKRSYALILLSLLILICIVIALCLKHRDKGDASGSMATPSVVYPLFSGKPFPLPDTLQYFYNTIDTRGKALSGGEFFVKIKYPIIRSENKNAQKMENWLRGQIFQLALESIPQIEDEAAYFGNNYTAYANATLNSWLSYEESTYIGCMQESLAVEIILNSKVLTFKVSHSGYWGGAHGDRTEAYTMFDQDFNMLHLNSLIEPDKFDDFQKLMIQEYDLQVDPFRDYDDNYKSNPESCGLSSSGMISQYFSYDYAEGNPQVIIPYLKILPYLKSEYQDVFSNTRKDKNK